MSELADWLDEKAAKWRQDVGDDLLGGYATLRFPLSTLLANYVPGSQPQPWTWDDEERELLSHVCLCCEQPGHYQLELEKYLADHGLTQGVCLGTDGRVWDGHHRIVAARRLGLSSVPIERT